MEKNKFDSALRRQVLSLPQLMKEQYMDLEPKTRTVLSTPEIFNIQRIVLTGCGDSYAAALVSKHAFEKYAKIRTEVVTTIDLARAYEKKNL
ncbi:MAG: sugar isomerase, partial [Christensenellaceae bacterium]|nr:sugar isomerase [Christensenellaceae bacterium]